MGDVAAPVEKPQDKSVEGPEADKAKSEDHVQESTEHDDTTPAFHSPNGDILSNNDWRELRNSENKSNQADSRHHDGSGRRKPYISKSSKSKRANNKSSQLERSESSNHEEIRKQVLFYFSENNLPKDKFLLSKTEGHANHPVPIKVIHDFSRMRHFKPYAEVVKALRDCGDLVVTDGPDGEEAVSRKIPLDSKYTTDAYKNQRILNEEMPKQTIYAKGFGDEQPTTQQDVETLFQPFGAVAVRLRRRPDSAFKGSAFVEFASKEAGAEFLAQHGKTLEWNGKPLEMMQKLDYHEKKAIEREEFRKEHGQEEYDRKYDNNRPSWRGARDKRGSGRQGSHRGSAHDRHGGKRERGSNGNDQNRDASKRKRAASSDGQSADKEPAAKKTKDGDDGDEW